MIVSAITTALTPLWTSRESRTIEGILHASATSGDRHGSPTPILYDVDVIKLEKNAQDGGSASFHLFICVTNFIKRGRNGALERLLNRT